MMLHPLPYMVMEDTQWPTINTTVTLLSDHFSPATTADKGQQTPVARASEPATLRHSDQ
jgi:hypothetical protein